MLNRYFANVGVLETQPGEQAGWIGCWYIYDRQASDPLQPLLSGRCSQVWADAASSLVAAYDEAHACIDRLGADAKSRG